MTIITECLGCCTIDNTGEATFHLRFQESDEEFSPVENLCRQVNYYCDKHLVQRYHEEKNQVQNLNTEKGKIEEVTSHLDKTGVSIYGIGPSYTYEIVLPLGYHHQLLRALTKEKEKRKIK